MREHVSDLRLVRIIDGAGHWVQQERPAEVNAALLEFLEDGLLGQRRIERASAMSAERVRWMREERARP